MSAHCAVLDLRGRFGALFRIRREAGGDTWHETPKDERVWLLEVRCRSGVVYAHGGEILAAATDRRGIGARLRRLPFILSARGDHETVVTFADDDVEAVFAILKPYRRRRLSEAQRVRNTETLARARQRRQESMTQDDFTEPGSTPTSEDSPESQPEPEVLAAGPEVVTTEGKGTRRSRPADECDAPGAAQVVTEQASGIGTARPEGAGMTRESTR
jgi:hypothetical protein